MYFHLKLCLKLYYASKKTYSDWDWLKDITHKGLGKEKGKEKEKKKRKERKEGKKEFTNMVCVWMNRWKHRHMSILATAVALHMLSLTFLYFKI